MSAGRVAVFFSKTCATQPNRCYLQIHPTLARSSLDSRRSGDISTVFGKIKLRFEEIQRYQAQIRRDPARSRPYLVRSSLDLRRFGNIKLRFEEIRRVFPKTGEIFQKPMYFPNSGNFFFFFLFFFFRFRCFFYSGDPMWPDRCSPSPKTDSTDFPARVRVPPPSTQHQWVESGLGLNPTCGQPYLKNIQKP